MARKRSPARLVIALSIAAVLAVFLLYTSIAGGGTPSVKPSELAGTTGPVSLVGQVVGKPVGDANEGGLLSLEVSVADPDADPILSLSADLSRLPVGHDALFTPGPDHTSGVLTWHPSFGDAGTMIARAPKVTR